VTLRLSKPGDLHLPLNDDPPGDLDRATRQTVPLSRTGTKPLPPSQTLLHRPLGAIFNDAFLAVGLIFSGEHQHRYLVKPLPVPDEQQIRLCPNHSCGAVFPYVGNPPEKFCTDCGTPLENRVPDLALAETDIPAPANITRLVARGLSHGSLRAPLVMFEERVASSMRYCKVYIPVEAMDGKPDTPQALQWGSELARGLDYLHDNGVSFNGELDEANFGLAEKRAVWSDFQGCIHHPGGIVTDRQPDLQALAMLIFRWLTGKSKFEHDPSLLPGVSRVIERAFAPPGYATGQEFAEALAKASEQLAAPQAVDFRLGRRTHVGMSRSLNEDSLLTLEINRYQQSVSQPLGVFVVADGMGGHAAGEVASGAIVTSIVQQALAELMPGHISQGSVPERTEWLRNAVDVSNQELYSLRKTAGTDMGSTLVSAIVEGNKASLVHVGDSRAYLINAKGIRQLTIDHSLVERLVATNQITREEARHHPQRNVIYRTMGDKPKIDLDTTECTLSPGDFLLLCSDGLCGMVEDQVIQDTVLQARSPQEACDRLIEAANAAGGEDNISVIIVGIVKP
jgi:protein phosphatase